MQQRLCNISFHSSSHCGDDVILHPEIFAELNPGDLIQIWDPDFPSNKLIVKVPIKSSKSSLARIELSVLKPLSDSAGFKQFGKVLVVPVTEEEASLDFVELSFKRQYLQRGNMLRFKTSFIGRTVYMNQNLNIDSVQAQIQDLRMGGMNSQKSISGLVTDSTKFVFRSKSARVIWLVQISAEMWDFDMVSCVYIYNTLCMHIKSRAYILHLLISPYLSW
ncbi:vacuolar membrane-associated protein Iml1 [archaeon]|nr:MAG: vacuolar membrane-associated protein Iml1 [archaeon]